MSDNIWRTDCLNLGHQGENGARELKVYVTDWQEEYPTATIRLQILRPGEDVPYYAEGVTVDGGVLTWIPSSADTGFGGYGKAELQAVQGETIVKSAVVKTFTEPCLPGTAGEVPPSMKPWTDAIEEAIEDIGGKLDAPETAGTAGQVLKLSADLEPVWGNGGGGGSDLPEGGSAGDVLMKTADGLEWSDDVTELKSALSVLEPSASASDVGKFLKAKTVADGKVTEYEFGSGGGGSSDIDDTAGAGDTDKAWSANKLTGEFGNVNQIINTMLDGNQIINYTTSAGYIESAGTIHTPSANQEVYTNKIAVKPGDIINISLSYGTASNTIWLAVGLYNASQGWVSRVDLKTSGTGSYTGSYTIPDDVYYVSFTYRTYGDASVIFTWRLKFVESILDIVDEGKLEIPYTTKNGWINASGGIGTQSSSNLEVYTSTYFAVNPGDKIDLSLVYGNNTKTVWLAIAYYDSSKTFIQRNEYDTTSVGSHHSTFTVRSDVYYLRFTWRTYGDAVFKVKVPFSYVTEIERNICVESGGHGYTGERIIISDNDNAPHWCNVSIWNTYNSDNIPAGASATAVLANNQSMTVFGNYMFLFSEHGGGAVIDLSTKTMISTFESEPTANQHQNSVQFSNIYHTAGDEFPLLYVSRCGNSAYQSGEHTLDEMLVYRVTRSGTTFTFTLINSIFNPVQTYGASWAVDNITHKLFCAGPLISNFQNPEGNRTGFWIFDEPSKSDIISGTPIILTNAVAYYEMDYFTVQGCCANGGKMYVGATNGISHEIWVTDVLSGRILTKLPVVLGWEMEGVAIHNGYIYTSNKSASVVRIYKITV